MADGGRRNHHHRCHERHRAFTLPPYHSCHPVARQVKLDSCLRPDFSDTELLREMCHWGYTRTADATADATADGASSSPDGTSGSDGTPNNTTSNVRLKEMGTVYQEMPTQPYPNPYPNPTLTLP